MATTKKARKQKSKAKSGKLGMTRSGQIRLNPSPLATQYGGMVRG
jgi:hypothetical protein